MLLSATHTKHKARGCDKTCERQCLAGDKGEARGSGPLAGGVPESSNEGGSMYQRPLSCWSLQIQDHPQSHPKPVPYLRRVQGLFLAQLSPFLLLATAPSSTFCL